MTIFRRKITTEEINKSILYLIDEGGINYFINEYCSEDTKIKIHIDGMFYISRAICFGFWHIKIPIVPDLTNDAAVINKVAPQNFYHDNFISDRAELEITINGFDIQKRELQITVVKII